jgi:hypothetical protein
VGLSLDFRWRRPRHELPTDPAAAAKMWGLCERLLCAPAEAAILARDACDVHLLPVLRAMWMRRSQQVRVPTPRHQPQAHGLRGAGTGRRTLALPGRGAQAGRRLLAFLEQLVLAYRDRPVLLVVDNASSHTAKLVEAWLADHPQVHLLWLPTYSGHKENPVEKVWWRLKDQVGFGPTGAADGNEEARSHRRVP